MTNFDELEADLAEFDQALVEMGVAIEERQDLVDRFRVLALDGTGTRHKWQVFELMLDYTRVVEGAIRRGEAIEGADILARFVEGVDLYFDLPDDLRVAAGLPAVD